jgi:pimeloyl-ACP methyl ester carboxylesterase
MRQQIRYITTADGVRIAFAATGEGTPIVRTSMWMTHLQHDFTEPVWRHVMLGLVRRHRLVRYDPRGEGMSQREVADISLEGWIRDLEAVVDALALPRFILFGTSQGAATAIAYAVRHPERVSHLILYGGFARGHLHRGGDQLVVRKGLDLAKELILQGWGRRDAAHRQWFTSTFLPEGSADQYRWFNRLQKISASPDVAARRVETVAALDVSALLPKVKAPTLVLHCRDDNVVPFAMGEELAAAIPGARLVPLEGENHLFLADSPAHRDFIHAVYEFLGDPPPRGHLPGTRTFWERIDHSIRTTEQNWLIKAALLIGAVIGLVLSIVQIAEAFG